MTANKVFISFRFEDGKEYKDKLVQKFEELDYTINKSEDEDRSNMSDETIQKYLYQKLRDTSLTVVLLTPKAINYKKTFDYSKFETVYDDWIYDEVRYSLEDRCNNRTNGIIAVYTPEAKSQIILKETEEKITISNFENLVRKNMFNIQEGYKVCPKQGLYNNLKDNYISIVSFDDFMSNPKMYIDSALEKREKLDHFKPLVKRMKPQY